MRDPTITKIKHISSDLERYYFPILWLDLFLVILNMNEFNKKLSISNKHTFHPSNIFLKYGNLLELLCQYNYVANNLFDFKYYIKN